MQTRSIRDEIEKRLDSVNRIYAQENPDVVKADCDYCDSLGDWRMDNWRRMNLKCLQCQKILCDYCRYSTKFRRYKRDSDKIVLVPYICKCCVNYLSALKIQIHWKKSISNPKFMLCKRRLMREYAENPFI